MVGNHLWQTELTLGSDDLYGGDGDDLLIATRGIDTFNGGAGNDTLDFSAFFDDLSFDLTGGQIGGGGFVRMIDLEHLIATTGDNLITGTDGDNSIAALAGNDTLMGGLGADTLDGGDNEDTVDYSGSLEAIWVELGPGTGSGGQAEGDVLSNIENVVGTAFGDVIFGDASSNKLYGGDGIDALIGGAGADTLDGGDSLDWAAYFDAPGPLNIDLETPALSSSYFAEDTLISIEIIGGATNFSNTFNGASASDIFIGGLANDTIEGGGGHDLLQGGGADDVIWGEAGRDGIFGNKGDDVLYGGADDDGFYFQNDDGHDVIKDFDIAAGDKFVFISTTFTQISDLSFSEVGGNAVITYGTATITVEGVTQAQIDDDASLYLWY